MEKKSLSAVDTSKKLIYEYIVLSFILAIISSIFTGMISELINNTYLKLLIQVVVSTIITIIWIRMGIKNTSKKYYIRKEDILLILKNVAIFFVILILLGFIIDYISFQNLLKKEAALYTRTTPLIYADTNLIAEETVKAYKNNENISPSEVLNNVRERQEEKIRKEFIKKYAYILYIPTIYNMVLYGAMMGFQKKWLTDVAEY